MSPANVPVSVKSCCVEAYKDLQVPVSIEQFSKDVRANMKSRAGRYRTVKRGLDAFFADKESHIHICDHGLTLLPLHTLDYECPQCNTEQPKKEVTAVTYSKAHSPENTYLVLNDVLSELNTSEGIVRFERFGDLQRVFADKLDITVNNAWHWANKFKLLGIGESTPDGGFELITNTPLTLEMVAKMEAERTEARRQYQAAKRADKAASPHSKVVVTQEMIEEITLKESTPSVIVDESETSPMPELRHKTAPIELSPEEIVRIVAAELANSRKFTRDLFGKLDEMEEVKNEALRLADMHRGDAETAKASAREAHETVGQLQSQLERATSTIDEQVTQIADLEQRNAQLERRVEQLVRDLASSEEEREKVVKPVNLLNILREQGVDDILGPVTTAPEQHQS